MQARGDRREAERHEKPLCLSRVFLSSWAAKHSDVGWRALRRHFDRARGCPLSGYLGMSVEMQEKVYGHHHPDYLQAAVAAIGNGSRTKQEQRKTVSVGIAVGSQEIRKPKP
jgi:hypothetical protein